VFQKIYCLCLQGRIQQLWESGRLYRSKEKGKESRITLLFDSSSGQGTGVNCGLETQKRCLYAE
jgi:hypothetical protein